MSDLQDIADDAKGWEPGDRDPKDLVVTPAPKGLTSRKEWDRQRLQNIYNAMKRYTEGGLTVPIEWIEEAKELSQ